MKVLLEQSSQLGNGYANIQLAENYYDGVNGVEQSYELAFQKYKNTINLRTVEGLEGLYNVG